MSDRNDSKNEIKKYFGEGCTQVDQLSEPEIY